MRLYCTPGGNWQGTEKAYISALKAEGIDPKTYTGRRQVDVPTDKPGLLEFLTFCNVNPIGGTPALVVPVDHGPGPIVEQQPTTVSFPSQGADLDTLFLAAPLGQQLTLAGIACENAYKKIG